MTSVASHAPPTISPAAMSLGQWAPIRNRAAPTSPTSAANSSHATAFSTQLCDAATQNQVSSPYTTSVCEAWPEG